MRAKIERGAISQCAASPIRIASSTARRFSTGSTPGIAMQTGQTLLFAAAPKLVEHPQNSFDRVIRWVWTSSPITASYAPEAIA